MSPFVKDQLADPVAAPPSHAPSLTTLEPPRRLWIVAMLFVLVFMFAGAIYANLAFAVTNQVDLEFFPPFKKYVNANTNHHLGAENFNIARSIAAGEGFASPWNGEKT